MSDLAQELIPPDYRNLVINPSGETDISATWFASNGRVVTGAQTVAPVTGTGHVEYTVTGTTSLPYYFAPFGPTGETHHSAFKIPNSRTVSGRVQLKSNVDVWVELQAQYYVWNGVYLVPIATHTISSVNVEVLDPTDTGGYESDDGTTFITGGTTGQVDDLDSTVWLTGPNAGNVDPADPNVFIDTEILTTQLDPSLIPTYYEVKPSDGDLLVSEFPVVFDFYAEATELDPPVIEFTAPPGGTVITTTAQKLIEGDPWVQMYGYGDHTNVPAGSTHWALLISVSGSDPAGFVKKAPSFGTQVYADQAFVSDSGAQLLGTSYFDGDTFGAYYWEGMVHQSTSRTGNKPANNGTGENEAPPGGEYPGHEEPPELEPTPPEYPPPLPPVHVVRERTTAEVAADVLTWKYTPQNLCLKSDVQIANLRLNSMDERGVVWIVSDIEGWWTLPEPDVPDMPRGWFDGSYETRGRYNARVVTITGSFFPSHADDVPEARGRLTRAVNLCHRGDFFMTHEDATTARSNTKGSKVWLSGAPQISTVNASGRTDFSIGLRAPDPIKYRFKNGVPPGYESLTITTNTRRDYPERGFPHGYPWAYPESIFGLTEASAINYGDTIVWPTLTLKGPTRGVVNITNGDTQQEMRVVRQLAASEELVINTFTKEVTLNGVGNYRFYLDIDVDWLMLQPGPNRLYFTEETAGDQRTELDVLWRSGWIG